MNKPVFDREAGKKACNVSVNKDLLAKAREAGIPISSLLEDALEAELRARTEEAWRKDNARAIEAHNDRIEAEGTFAEQEGLL